MTVQSSRITSSNPPQMPAMSEADLQRLISDAASALGWRWLHIYPLRTRARWATPVAGSLGEGFQDLFLCLPRQRRLLAIELKAARGTVSAEQLTTHALLVASGLEVLIVRPADSTTSCASWPRTLPQAGNYDLPTRPAPLS